MAPMRYPVRVCVRGEPGETLSAMFDGLRVEPGAEGTTVISGEVSDQSALHGLLASIRDLGLSLVSVETFGSEDPEQSRAAR